MPDVSLSAFLRDDAEREALDVAEQHLRSQSPTCADRVDSEYGMMLVTLSAIVKADFPGDRGKFALRTLATLRSDVGTETLRTVAPEIYEAILDARYCDDDEEEEANNV